jgi:hypothetical protein
MGKKFVQNVNTKLSGEFLSELRHYNVLWRADARSHFTLKQSQSGKGGGGGGLGTKRKYWLHKHIVDMCIVRVNLLGISTV